MERIPSIAIVGAGFSGSLLAVHLARGATRPLHVTLIDRRGSRGRGLAYSTSNPNHLLNVRVENMSAFPEAPTHFRDWLERRTGRPVDRLAFASRGLYGAYVEEMLSDAIAETRGRISVEVVAAVCVDLREERDGWRLSLSEGGAVEADAVALCLGNFPPRAPGLLEEAVGDDPRIIVDPWRVEGLGSILPEERVIILGSGLTMADVAVQLSDQGHRGEIVALSRHGLRSNVHAWAQTWPSFLDPDRLPGTALSLFRRVREEVRRADRRDVGWRSIVDSLRPLTVQTWRALPLAEQKRALRHLRAYWDVHRHRIAPEIDVRLKRLSTMGQLRHVAGSILSARATEQAIEIDVRRRKEGAVETLSAERVINCTGPCSIERIDDPLIRSLLRQGTARADSLGLGLDVTQNCHVVAAEGRPHVTLFATGPLSRGAFWEMLAVPELRQQAPAVAARVLGAIEEHLEANADASHPEN